MLLPLPSFMIITPSTFLNPLYAFLRAYLCSLAAVFLIGLILVLFDRDWGPFAEMYLKAVALLQDCLIKLHDLPDTLHMHSSPTKLLWDFFSSSSPSPSSAADASDSDSNSTGEGLTSSTNGSESSFELVQVPLQSPAMSPLEMAIELCGQGIESIVKEDVGAGFRLAPDYRRYELNPFRIPKRKLSVLPTPDEHHRWVRRVFRRLRSRVHHRFRQKGSSTSSKHRYATIKRRFLRVILFCTMSVRLGALFPVRLAFLFASFAILFTCCLWNFFKPLTPRLKTRCAVIYCRLYNLGCGFIIRYHHPENRPKKPGVICANHLSPNDVHVIFGDIPHDRDYLYMVTGQKHQGFIWVLENLVDKVCPALWLERADAESRRQFSIQVLEAARNSGPVILFPEGYCTNNSYVLMFRRAVFQEDVTVYPVAIRQEPRFGDAYWSENNFMHYLFRVLTSWAIVYNVYYLVPQHRLPNENATEFAARVQQLIATKIGVRAVGYDGGGLWYKSADRRKAFVEWQKRSAAELEERLKERKTESDGELEMDSENRTPIVADIADESGRKGLASRKAASLPAMSARPSVATENLLSPAATVEEGEQRRRRRRRAATVDSDSDEMDLIG